MIEEQLQRAVPGTCEHVYAVVADVEAYPEFLPGWNSVRVLARDDRTCTVEQTLQLGPLNWHFHSHARFDPPHGVDIRSQDGPFRELYLQWRFAPQTPRVCLVALNQVVRLRSSWQERMARPLLRLQAEQVMSAFEAEAARRTAHVFNNNNE